MSVSTFLFLFSVKFKPCIPRVEQILDPELLAQVGWCIIIITISLKRRKERRKNVCLKQTATLPFLFLLFCAGSVLKNRGYTSNPVTAILLLTDGRDMDTSSRPVEASQQVSRLTLLFLRTR